VDLKFRDTLPPEVLHELEQYNANLNQYIYREHDENGKHTDVTADSVSLQGANIGEVVDLPYSSVRYTTGGSGTWTVEQTDQSFLRYVRVGQMVVLNFALGNTVISVDTPTDDLIINLPEFQAITGKATSGGIYLAANGVASYANTTEAVTGFCRAYVEAVNVAGFMPYTRVGLYGMQVTFAALPVTISFWGTLTFFIQPNNTAVSFSGQ
jgi:hypothetical protein